MRRGLADSAIATLQAKPPPADKPTVTYRVRRERVRHARPPLIVHPLDLDAYRARGIDAVPDEPISVGPFLLDAQTATDLGMTRIVNTLVADARAFEDTLPALPDGYQWDVTFGFDPANYAHVVFGARVKKLPQPVSQTTG